MSEIDELLGQWNPTKQAVKELIARGHLSSEDEASFVSSLFTISERYKAHKEHERSEKTDPWDRSVAWQKDRNTAMNKLEAAKNAIGTLDWLEFQTLEALNSAIEKSINDLSSEKKKGRKNDDALGVLCSCFMHVWDVYKNKKSADFPVELLSLAKVFLSFCGYEARNEDGDRAKLLRRARDNYPVFNKKGEASLPFVIVKGKKSD